MQPTTDAIACGAGTIYRNDFVPVGGKAGQKRSGQIDCLSDLGNALNNQKYEYWSMVNGYALPKVGGLDRLNRTLQGLRSVERNELIGLVRVGVQADTEVTCSSAGHLVTQVYCSAMPVSYGGDHPNDWAPIARMVLDAAYEATLLQAVKNFK